MFNDAILNKYIIMYKCVLVGIYYLVYRFAFGESNVARKWIESYSLMNLHLAQQMMGRF
jgi:hypothetical protein